MNIEKFITELPEIENVGYDLENDCPTSAKPKAFIVDGKLIVSAEDGSGLVDYYGEFRGGLPYIHLKLEEWAKERKCYWEWEDPGCISLEEC